jgi:8-oxo-dGTP pyrophosphatase MutT (NUDIX family)
MSTPHLACTVLLLRDRAQGLQVLMVQRSHRVDFAEGAMVFPGGRVDPGDAEPAWRSRVRGADAFDAEALRLRVAAIRETFEESGVLLAGARGSSALMGAAELERLQPCRAPIASGTESFHALIEREGLELDAAALVPWARWITPDLLPKRFDTYFYAVAAPPDQLAVHDGQELVASAWLRPQEALDDAAQGRRKLVFATLMNLERLAATRDVDTTLSGARRQAIVAVEPQVVQVGNETWLEIPADAGYARTRAPAQGLASP